MRIWPARKKDFARTTLSDAPIMAVATPDAVEDGKQERTPTIEQWQDLVLRYANRIPIVSAACRYYNSNTQRVTYDIVDENSDDAVEAPEAQELAAILNAFPEEMGRAVELLFLIGEARQSYSANDGLKTYGAGELVKREGSLVIVDHDGKRRELGDDVRAWRTWEPDRRWSYKATSSHKAMLDLLEAFVIAYAEERAVSIRLAMNTGFVLISEDALVEEGNENVDDPGETYGSGGRARLERRLEQMLQMTIKNPRNAASFNPPVIVTRSGLPVKDLMAHVGFAAERDKRQIQERLDMLKREYAVGSDLPADIAAGFLADLNHWNARSVDANAWKNFLAPKIQMVANNVFQELALGMGIDIEGWKVVPNGRDLIDPTMQAEHAVDAWDRGLISDDTARRSLGYNEADAAGPDDGPEFPIGSQSPPRQFDDKKRSAFAASQLNFATDVGRAKLKRMSREIQLSAEIMRDEILTALTETAELLTADRVTAAAGDPLDTMIDNITAAILKQKKQMSVAAARAIATNRAKDWYDRTDTVLEKRATKASKDAAKILARAVRDNSFTPGVARDITRHAESLSSGGPRNLKPNADVNNMRPLTTQEDTEFVGMLKDEVLNLVITFGWVHGGSASPFPAHVELDGETWTPDEERDVLNNPDDFPASAVYYPGDHSGCSCSYDATYEAI